MAEYIGFDSEINTVTAAQNALINISQDPKITPEFLESNKYDAIRILRQIEGLQDVLVKNGGVQPHTWLPFLSKSKFKRVHLQATTHNGKDTTV